MDGKQQILLHIASGAIYAGLTPVLAFRCAMNSMGGERYLLTSSQRLEGSPALFASPDGQRQRGAMTVLPKATCTIPTARGAWQKWRNISIWVLT